MSAAVIPFPARRIATITICRERDGQGWLTIAGAHGWLHGSLVDAVIEAVGLARTLGLPVRGRGHE